MSPSDSHRPWWSWPLLIVALPLVVVWMIVWSAAAISLLLVVWTTWCPRGRYALVVYSNSPVWHPYFEARVLPAIRDRAIVLNWSERKRWTFSFPVALFNLFAGSRDFNPVVIVFEPWKWPRRFRFYQPFQAFKHGRGEAVEQMRVDVIRLLDHLTVNASSSPDR